METLIKHMTNIVEVDGSTFLVILMICCAAMWFIREGLANPAMIVFIFPFVFLLSLTFYYVFAQFELFASNKMEQWLMWAIMAGSLGVSIGIGSVALLARFWDRPNAG